MNREIKEALVQLVVRIIYAVAALMLFFIVYGVTEYVFQPPEMIEIVVLMSTAFLIAIKVLFI
ncbi:hypothetical protein [Megasphaera stantonii]|jgi:hypothetical protein|uniref:hypothetical protein n=1 Tax=Megasphaera stantonii TaxID=2144175 RepID=UPI0023F020A9|nr:hypothetical protein [Megasphaera stantonii]